MSELGPRLYMAAISMDNVMKDREYFLMWVEQRLHEDGGESLNFFDHYTIKCRHDAESMLLDISSRIFSSTSSNMKELLAIRQEQLDAPESILKKFRKALKAEGKALSSNTTVLGRDIDFLVHTLWGLGCALAQGEHCEGVLNKGVIERVRNGVGLGFGLTEAQAQKIWKNNKEWIQERTIVFTDGKGSFRLEGRKVRFVLSDRE